jgi:WD40 repeat protein
MKKLILILLFLQRVTLGQGIDNLWLMGYQCCTSPNFHTMNLEFKSGSIVIDTAIRHMNLNCTNGVICDKNSDLLFYSNGVYIANALNDTMLNGSGLNPCDFTTIHTPLGLTIPQANLIIPFPDDSMKYYLFHESADDYVNTYSSFFLYYSVIDMSLDGGLGGVVQKNTVLLNDTLVEGRLTACKHANGRDWWLFSHEFLTGKMYKFLITPQGIQGPTTQNLQTIRDNYFGQAVFSRQGNKFAYYEPYGDLDIFNFDRCNGNFFQQVHISINDTAAAGGVAFSPNGRYLYVSSTRYVYQFDMSAPNIAVSQTTVAVWDTFYSPWPPAAANFYLAQLAPDNKIYINCGNSTKVLHKFS